MAAGDPMLSPVAAEQDMGPPPPINTTPTNQPPQHQQMQQLMAAEMPAAPARKAARSASKVPADMKDAVAVALVAFAVLLPNVQAMLAARLSVMRTPTNATLLNAIAIAVAFHMLKEHVVGML